MKLLLRFTFFSLLFSPVLSGIAADNAAIQSPIDHSSELEAIRTDFELCDGPAWSGGMLYVTDVKAGRIEAFHVRQKRWYTIRPEAGRVSALFFNHGQMMACHNGDCQILKIDRKETSLLADLSQYSKPGTARPNDFVVDRTGRIYTTLTRQNEVVCIQPGDAAIKVVAKLNAPNGLILSPDEKTLYVAAFREKVIYAYQRDTETGEVTSEGRRFAALDAGEALGADGMSIDRAGNVYCCGPESVWIWNPEGELLDRLSMPSRPINCTFGDPQMRTLFITCFGGLYAQKMRVSGVSPEPQRISAEGIDPDQPGKAPTEVPKNITAHVGLTYSTVGSRKLLGDLFVPQNRSKPLPAIVVVHGGGWLKGDKTKFRAMAIALAQKGFVTFAPEYRLGEEALFPAGSHDVHTAVRFLRANAKTYGIQPDRIGAVGGSAGGHLVGLLATGGDLPELRGTGNWDGVSSKIQAAVVLAGPMEMTTGSVAERSRTKPKTSNANMWLGGTIDEKPALYALADAHLKISKDDCPILFMAGEKDNPQRNAPSREKLKAVGVHTGLISYPGAKHGAWNSFPWFDEYINDIAAFLEQLKL